MSLMSALALPFVLSPPGEYLTSVLWCFFLYKQDIEEGQNVGRNLMGQLKSGMYSDAMSGTEVEANIRLTLEMILLV